MVLGLKAVSLKTLALAVSVSIQSVTGIAGLAYYYCQPEGEALVYSQRDAGHIDGKSCREASERLTGTIVKG